MLVLVPVATHVNVSVPSPIDTSVDIGTASPNSAPVPMSLLVGIAGGAVALVVAVALLAYAVARGKIRFSRGKGGAKGTHGDQGACTFN